MLRRPSSLDTSKVQDEKNVSIEERDDGSTLVDQTHRKLKTRHVQLIGIGGATGTGLFLSIGSGLTKGGPGSLLLAVLIWCSVILAVNNSLAEMVIWIPISSPFLRFADHFVDEAFGVCAAVNFFLLQAFQVPFEIVAITIVVEYWTDKIPPAAIIMIVILSYAAFNFWGVRWYGETEFWLAIGKVILAFMLMGFTLVTMLGGNPLHDRFGFRNWNPSKVPGAPFAEYIEKDSLGRFMGLLACFIQASFFVAGPEYVGMSAGEAELPRKTMTRAFGTVFFRMATFYIIGALSVGIVVPYNDKDLLNALSSGRPGAGSSPYVIAMNQLKIPVLPHIVNFLILSSIFSAGNGYTYCASRTLLGLALEGKAPRFLAKCTSNGVPVYCVAITVGFSLLALLRVSHNSAVVIQWLINIVTASQVLNFGFISFTYIFFHRALKAQGISRDSLPYKGYLQPFSGYYGLIGTILMVLMSGYTVFLKGRWSGPDFIFSYIMVGFLPALFVFWKLLRKTKWRDPKTVQFFPEERKVIDNYEESQATD